MQGVVVHECSNSYAADFLGYQPSEGVGFILKGATTSDLYFSTCDISSAFSIIFTATFVIYLTIKGYKYLNTVFNS